MRNILFIEGGAYTDIKKALDQWIDLSAETLKVGLTFELYKAGRGRHVIKADNELPDEQFGYLLNYLKYPEGIDYKIDVTGYTKVSEPTVFPPEFIGKEIELFIPDSDDEYDNVYWATKENKVFKTDFGGKTVLTEILKEYEPTAFDPDEYPAPEIFYSKPVANTDQLPLEEGEDERTIGKRFKIIGIIITVLIVVGIFTFNKPDFFMKITTLTGIGMMTWFFSDYKMLRVNKYYLFSLGIAVGMFFYGYAVMNSPPYFYKFMKRFDFIFAMPLLFIVVQKPVRLIFIRIMKREPVIEKPMPTLADGLYAIAIVIIMIAIGLLFLGKLFNV
jgi:hypothetical protein